MKRTWLVLVAIGVVSCGGQAATVDTAPDQPAPVVTAAPSTTIDTALEPTLDELEVGLPRTSTYSILDVEITRAVLGDVDPRTFLLERDVKADGTYLFVHLNLDNRSSTDTANWVPSPLHLVVNGAVVPPPELLASRPNIGLTPLRSTEMWLAFEVPADTTFEDASFVLAQDGRIPMVLPLTGPVPHPEYPAGLDLSAEGPAQGQGIGCRQSLDVTVLGGSVSVDLVDTDYPTEYGARRALVGERFLSVPLRILNNGGSRCGGGSTNFGNHDVRLLVDGVPRQPITWVNAGIPVDVAEDFVFHFAFPLSASELALTVGAEEGTLFSVPVDLPDLPEVAGESLLEAASR